MSNLVLCKIRVSEVPLHLYQIITGFQMLQEQDKIRLELEESESILPYNMMEVESNGTRILYDVNDGYDNWISKDQDALKVYDKLLDNYDICFKRSFSKEINRNLSNGYKINPLGLNYLVTIKNNYAHKVFSHDRKKEKIKKIIRKIPFTQYYNNKFLVNTFECAPKLSNNPKILFMARLWDPNGEELRNMSKEKVEERIEINNVRIECIRQCRKEFGERFIGGITPNEFSVRNYSDLVIKDTNIVKKENYIKTMQKCDICVATTGLHNSIGWKFAEYVAASKAIITEPLHYSLPGDFKKENNYLEFNNVEDYLNNIYLLLEDKELCFEIMKNNHEYYKSYVRPDSMILNTLKESKVL